MIKSIMIRLPLVLSRQRPSTTGPEGRFSFYGELPMRLSVCFFQNRAVSDISITADRGPGPELVPEMSLLASSLRVYPGGVGGRGG